MKKNVLLSCLLLASIAITAQNTVSLNASFLTGSNALDEFSSDKFDIGNGVGSATSAEVGLDCEILKIDGHSLIVGLGIKNVTTSNQIFDGETSNALDVTIDYLPIKVQFNEYFGEQTRFGSYVGFNYLQKVDSEVFINNQEVKGLSTASMLGMEIGMTANLSSSSYFVGMNFLSSPFSNKDIQMSNVNIEFGVNLNLFSFSRN